MLLTALPSSYVFENTQESICNFLSAVSLLVPLKLSERHLTILYIANIKVYGVLYAQFPMFGIPLKVCLFVCLFEALRPGQQFFSHFGTAS